MAVLHGSLPVLPWRDPRLSRLPGIQPLDPADWLRVDAAYAGQMAERERLIATCPDAVHGLLPAAVAAARELYDAVLPRLPGLGFAPEGGGWRCPDGRHVVPNPAQPLLSLGRLLQEDFCLMQDGPDGHHVLTGAILCFPASWTLAEKLGRGLPGIHTPVAGYAGDLAVRVQRLFDAIRPEAPLWRANALTYADPALHQPRREGQEKPPTRGPDGYVRSERQCLLRLPVSRAVVFSIHTYVVRADSLPSEDLALLRQGRH
ncbi:MAG: DUF3445 domain-containing protein [Rhodobacter sp.]|uniref:heme-dependent oxidative N-demethylase family protein n=1 Tax=Pararhodobacter sp. TaxID=2127056 RepID=UPI001DACCC0E|nr:DUF3445 domain-containing protein [Pararhodobacter sp.]MCB1346394.1 DUF3445 domain-containing protein [Paracoccaceae bacterium]MCC0073332.1 DUF3445 domain-containing protein [Rhodobacter sp.]HPD93737.1 DUF3445 domain-containing protein [Pararhodobacter sp.]